MPKAQSTAVHFRIEGEFITDIVRTRVREGRWDWSWKLLMEDLHGMTHDIAIKILRGDAKLTSTNTLGLEDDDDQEYKRQLSWHFGGCYVTAAGRFMRPYAVVTSWGPDDMVEEGLGARSARFAHNSLYYANDAKQDEKETCRIDYPSLRRGGMTQGDVLFHEIRGFPHTLVEHAGLEKRQEAVDAYMALPHVPRLDERGHNQLNPEPVPRLKLVPRTSNDPLKWIREQNLAGKTDPTELCKEILNAAGDDLFPLTVDGIVHMVPTAPFENWALNRTAWWHLAPKWTPFSPQGMKMMGDDPYHSDWILGGGFELEDWIFAGDGPLNDAAMDAMHEVQKRYFNAKVVVLSGDGFVEGKVVHIEPGARFEHGEVGIIKNAGPDYVFAAQDAVTRGAVLITEVGGAVAHLVTVFRAQNLKIVREADARKKYVEGRYIKVDLTNGQVTLTERNAPIRLSDGTIIPNDGEDIYDS